MSEGIPVDDPEDGAAADRVVRCLGVAAGAAELRQLEVLLRSRPDDVEAAVRAYLERRDEGQWEDADARTEILLDLVGAWSLSEMRDVALVVVAMIGTRLDTEGHPLATEWSAVEALVHRLAPRIAQSKEAR